MTDADSDDEHEPALFFSSRRRHTKYWRDCSSDVCSSDLSAYLTLSAESAEEAERLYALLSDGGQIFMKMEETPFASRFAQRSEERRVGKECRSRWSTYLLKKKL